MSWIEEKREAERWIDQLQLRRPANGETLEQQTAVKNAMQRTGFTNIRHETFPDGHVVLPTQVQKALRWFRKGS